MKPEISLIVSIFNKIDILKLVLASLELQSFKNFEVLLSDDGSNQESVQEIATLQEGHSFTITHIWHANNGWNKNAILNKSIIASKSPYIIFIDGDCLLHLHFIKEHFKNKIPHTILAGRRVNLSQKITKKLTPQLISNGYLKSKITIQSLWQSIFSNARDAEQGIYITSIYIRRFLNRKDKGILGSNFSVFKQDLLNVNGFDERFLHPAAGEDTDIEARLRRNGLKVNTIRNQAIQYHIFHKELPRSKDRLQFLEENNANQVTYTPFGINKEK